MLKNMLITLCCLFLYGYTSAHASLIAVEDQGQLLGFDGIALNNQTYNVRFVEGSYISVFGDSAGLDFTTILGAKRASQALLDAFDLFPRYDDESSLTFGVTNNQQGHIFTPWFFRPYSNGTGFVHSVLYVNYDIDFTGPGATDYTSNNVGMIASYDTGGANNFSSPRVWANWSIATSQQTTPVPEPSIIALFGIGLAGLGFMRRRGALKV